jgi:hypothetical protein
MTTLAGENRTLTQALADLGIGHRASAETTTTGQRVLFDALGPLGAFDAFEAWDLVRRREALRATITTTEKPR